MVQEQTIREAVSFRGIGLHSGAAVNMRILPAPVGSGICFRRTDLDSFTVEAVGRNVARVSYATSLMKQGVLISTTEHVLSALMGSGIDNAVIELDQLELPILDGSAKPFLEAIRKAGVKRQRRHRVYCRIAQPLEIREGGKSLAIYPADRFSVAYTIDFLKPIGLQSFEIDLTGDAYTREIAPARTFGFLRDERALLNMGLIRGASEENAIVLTDKGVKNGPLRFPDEFVRHKILDLIGDFALLGHQILGKVVANRAGHAMHTALVSRLLRDRSLWQETTLPGEPIGDGAIRGKEAYEEATLVRS
ncbi:MAG TPA: UDP-3-O-acyl-N-acetylglucosamine deacetylase [Terriglobales bacterium]|nr:UDP-3-O-acyl-N-acetylglucosamine deacetylase [Terriglobales bacterium]